LWALGGWKGLQNQVPSVPAGKNLSRQNILSGCQADSFCLLSHFRAKLAEVTVIGYDSNQKVFTHTSFKSTGETELWRGTAEGDSWIWTKEEKVGGKPFEDRLAIKKKSSNSYSFVVEMKPADGDTWSTVAEGTGTKTK
jgi:hypothetical protein